MATISSSQENTVLAPGITVNPERLGGQSVIGVSRVPVATLLDYVDIEQFLHSFPSISRAECLAALDYLKEQAEDGQIGEPLKF